mgnify:FL=1
MTRDFPPNAGLPGTAFLCTHCNRAIPGTAPGTAHRNHCPHCLWSLHVDLTAGDRRSACRGPMEPIAIGIRPDGEWSILHRCQRCGLIRTNRIAGDDNDVLLMSMALRPLARPPFPLERLGCAPAGTEVQP